MHIEPEVAYNFSSGSSIFDKPYSHCILTRFTYVGGFSEYFARPKYQKNDVKGYFEFLGDTYKGLYNPKGRGRYAFFLYFHLSDAP